MFRTVKLALTTTAFLAIGLAVSALAQEKLTITAVTQPLNTQPQFTRVDQVRAARRPEGEVGWQDRGARSRPMPRRSLGGQEVLRLVRAGQVDIGASPLSTVSGDVPFLDGVDLAGLHPEITLARKVADALVPLANKELEKFGSRIIATYPFPAQVVFCRQPVSSLADLKGRKVARSAPRSTIS